MSCFFRVIFLVCLAGIVSACAPVAVEIPTISPTAEIAVAPTQVQTATAVATALSVATVLPTVTMLPTDTPIPLPTFTVTSTNTPSPTVTPLPPPSCPEPSTVAPFALPPNVVELKTAILDFVNKGGQWDVLLALLDELEIEHDAIQADMDGDGLMETAVYVQLADEDGTPHHAWWVLRCSYTNEYKVIYELQGNWAFHRYFIADDLNNDGRSEIIEVGGFAGSACHLEPRVWSWQAAGIVDLSPDHLELELGCTSDDRVVLRDMNGDGVKEMILAGETGGHLSDAPARGITQTLTLQDSRYKLESTSFASADLRIHVLDDAQRALDAGDLPSAVVYYTQAAYQEMITAQSYLLLFPHVLEDIPEADSYQKGFALFRLFVIQLATKNEEEAGLVLMDIDTQYLENTPGHEFAILAHIFKDAFAEEGNRGKACLQVVAYIADHYENQDPPLTSHFYWGDDIASYGTPHSFCPVFNVNALP
ncbi:MAG: hypothetical protein KC423_10995 [Anaerolineales bacterium]|nr:hypothetical protein [Anaerolineales bacterium]